MITYPNYAQDGMPAEGDDRPVSSINDSTPISVAARMYLERGYAPVPVRPRTKKPIHRDWTEGLVTPNNVDLYFDDSDLNIGLALGESSKGLVDIDLDCPEAVLLADAFLPPSASTFGRPSHPKSHRLYRVANDCSTSQFQDWEGEMLVEFRATGGITVVPPSTHPDNEPVRWETDGEPADVDGSDLLKRVKRLAAAVLLARHWPSQGSRHLASLALAGGLLRAGWNRVEVEHFIRSVAQAAADDEVEDRVGSVQTTEERLREGGEATGWPALVDLLREGERAVGRAARWLGVKVHSDIRSVTQVAGEIKDAAPNGSANSDDEALTLTDVGNANRLVRRFGHDLRYVPQWKSWLVWDKNRWVKDELNQVHELAKLTAQDIYREAAEEQDSGRRFLLGKHAERSQSASRLEAMIRVARTDPSVVLSASAFNQDPFLLNVANGIIDLRTGELRPHSREDKITLLAPVHYDPKVVAPTFEEFLERILPDEEMRKYVQRLVGYCLTGDTTEQAVFIFYGSGANGKTTLIEAIRAILGEYARQANPQTFLKKRLQGIRDDLARLRGSRFVSAVEASQGDRLDEALLKQISGNDVITGRPLYAQEFEYRPTFKVIFVTNQLPIIENSDHGIWRRIRLVPFEIRIDEEERDLRLLEKLRDELPGILNWAIEGTRSWLATGLGLPEQLVEATSAYRAKMDVTERFVRDRCIEVSGDNVTAGEMYTAYKQWCGASGEYPLSQKDFTEKLVDRGLRKKKSTGGRVRWLNVKLLAPEEVAPTDLDDELAPEGRTEAVMPPHSTDTASNFSTSLPLPKRGADQDDLDDLPF